LISVTGKDDERDNKLDELETKRRESAKFKDKTYHNIAMETMIRSVFLSSKMWHILCLLPRIFLYGSFAMQECGSVLVMQGSWQ
jgi:hypothetical protein